MRRLCILFFIAALLSECQSDGPKSKNKVLFVSILPLKYFTDKIVGGNWKVEVMVPPGAGPETYSPLPKQMMLLSGAKAYFSIGFPGFEQVWLENFRATHPQIKVFNITHKIDLIREDHQESGHAHAMGIDPHVWCSPKAANQIARNIFEGMKEIDPGNTDMYQKNFSTLLAEIQKVDSTITRLLSVSTSKQFIIFHPALGYFARDYGLEQLSIEFEGKVPSPKHLQAIIDAAKSGNIKCILIQKEFDIENAKIIAKETGSKIVQIDPLDYNWPEQMISIARKLSESQ